MSDFRTVDLQGWKVSNPFKVLTSFSVMDIDSDDYEGEIGRLVDEQADILQGMGIDFTDYYILIHFGMGDFYKVLNLDEALQCLALKDGADLVQFENGNIGFIGYYNGFNENWFEMIPTEVVSDHCQVKGNLIYVYEDNLEWVYKIDIPSEVDSAVHLIEWSIGAWYNVTDYPDYESCCIGDVIEEQLEDKCIGYSSERI